jgi:hypothetical protein
VKKQILMKIVTAGVLAVSVVGPVSAADGPFCAGEFRLLQETISYANFLNEKDRTGVSNKATQAEAKANLHKCSDALDKLDDIDMKVSSISDPEQTRKTKLGEDDANNIMLKTNNTAACIGTISPCITKGGRR